MTARYGEALTQEDRNYFERVNEGWKVTGETLILGDENESTTYAIFTGKWTRTYMVRDCGNHYIYAGYCGYYRIDKETLEVTRTDNDR